MPAITSAHLLLPSSSQDLSRGDLTRNKLFQLAGSPDDHTKLFDAVSALNGKRFEENEGNSALRVASVNGNGITCFQLSRVGKLETSGVVAVLVFNDKKEIVRW
jgi:hypothetical protein